MKFLILGAWPVGQVLIDEEFIRHQNGIKFDNNSIDTSQPQWAFLLNGPLAGGNAPPTNAQALDQATYDLMVRAHGREKVLYGPGVVPVTG